MGLYKLFSTDKNLEKGGIELDYGDLKITIARAGGANKRFARLLEAKTKPYKRAIQTETLDPERALGLMREVFAESVVLNWETKVDGKFKKGIENKKGELIPFNVENVIKTFENLPDLFTDIQEQAQKAALFREDIREEDAKN